MAEPFATPDDLEARWRPLSPAEKERATVLLGDASALIRDLAKGIDQRIADEQIDPATPKSIACAVVKRAMHSPAGYDGVTQAQSTAGPFQQGVTFANPSGDLYLTKLEKRRLGAGGQRAFMVDLAADANANADAPVIGEIWP